MRNEMILSRVIYRIFQVALTNKSVSKLFVFRFRTEETRAPRHTQLIFIYKFIIYHSTIIVNRHFARSLIQFTTRRIALFTLFMRFRYTLFWVRTCWKRQIIYCCDAIIMYIYILYFSQKTLSGCVTIRIFISHNIIIFVY